MRAPAFSSPRDTAILKALERGWTTARDVVKYAESHMAPGDFHNAAWTGAALTSALAGMCRAGLLERKPLEGITNRYDKKVYIYRRKS